MLMDTNYAALGRSSVGEQDAVFSPWARRRRPFVVGFVAALLLQTYLLYAYVPGPASGITIPHLDKVVHVGMFALPAFLGVLARLRLWLVGLILVVHAPVSELVQHRYLPGRAGDPADLIADLVGIGLGLVLGLLVLRRARMRS